MSLTPSTALLIDAGAQLILQTGFLVQKVGHKSVEEYNSQQDSAKNHRSGFCTWAWFLGILLTLSGAGLHAGKYIKSSL